MTTQTKTENSVRIEKSLLVEVLKKVSVAINGRTSIPVLTNVKVEVADQKIYITSTDSDMIAIATIDNEFEAENQTFLINHKELTAFLKKSKSTHIELTQLGKTTTNISSGKINYKLITGDVTEYPLNPVVKFDECTLTTEEFKKAMSNTVFAIATTESRPVLTGVKINFNKEGLQFVATDSHRLGLYNIKHITTENEYEAIPCGSTLGKIVKQLNKKTTLVNIGFSSNYTLIKFDNMEYWVRNIEGNYPEISRLIPTDFKTEITLETKEMIETLGTMQIVTDNNRNNVVRLAIENNTRMSCKNDDLTKEMFSDLAAYNLIGEQLKVAFSSKYMLESIKAINSNEIIVKFTGSMRPFIITSKESPGALQLILPVRTY